ncbi:MAG: site-specific DNA-methyltransferase [Planctomycetota bacterium]|nr:MAG: site-specific DNA-methyltransferase [Planctomycetota bacterium]
MSHEQKRRTSRHNVVLHCGDFREVCDSWPAPTVIVVDGPYGVGGFPGDPYSHAELPAWYEPHIAEMSARATPETTLWFWNTEVGWATVHPVLERLGWEYRSCHIWDKGVGHIAGNANSKTLRKFPVVTEVCVQYVRRVSIGANGSAQPLRDWFRNEWMRTGLPLYVANRACGVKNAATRKYLTKDHLFYFPPPEAYESIARYANRHGQAAGRPYYSAPDRDRPYSPEEWARMRAKFYCEVGVTNVWREPAVRGAERRKKTAHKCIHMNQKPLRLLELILRASSDPGDVVWEPFGGLCSTAIAAASTGRRCYSAEILPEYFAEASRRLAEYVPQSKARSADAIAPARETARHRSA